MLLVKVSASERGVIVSGSMRQILEDLGNTIAIIHSRLREENPEVAKEYQKAVKAMVCDPESPLWDMPIEPGKFDSTIISTMGGQKK